MRHARDFMAGVVIIVLSVAGGGVFTAAVVLLVRSVPGYEAWVVALLLVLGFGTLTMVAAWNRGD